MGKAMRTFLGFMVSAIILWGSVSITSFLWVRFYGVTVAQAYLATFCISGAVFFFTIPFYLAWNMWWDDLGKQLDRAQRKAVN